MFLDYIFSSFYQRPEYCAYESRFIFWRNRKDLHDFIC